MDTSGLASALTAPNDNRMVRLGIVEAQNLTAAPPTLTVDGRVMRYIQRVPIGQTAVYLAEGQDPLVIGKMSEGDDGIPIGGTVLSFRTTQPAGWLWCNGQSTAGYPALAAEVGATVPDLRGRFPVGAGGAYALNATGGAATVTLISDQMPVHKHGMPDHYHQVNNHAHSMPHTHTQTSHSHGFSATTGSVGDHTHNMPLSSIKTGPHDHNNEPGRLSEAPDVGVGGALTFMGSAGGHSHGLSGTTGSAGGGETGSTNTLTSSESPGTSFRVGGGTTDNTGGFAGTTSAHENRPPYRACYYLIRAE